MTEDILERAKSLRHYLANKAEWQDESVIVGELISEVERLRSENEALKEKLVEERTAYLAACAEDEWNLNEMAETDVMEYRKNARQQLAEELKAAGVRWE